MWGFSINNGFAEKLFIELSQISCIEAGVLKNPLVNSIPNFLGKRRDALLAELR